MIYLKVLVDRHLGRGFHGGTLVCLIVLCVAVFVVGERAMGGGEVQVSA